MLVINLNVLYYCNNVIYYFSKNGNSKERRQHISRGGPTVGKITPFTSEMVLTLTLFNLEERS